MWSVYADAGEYTIEGEFYFESVYGGGGGSANTLEFSNTFICDVVPVESHSWTSVKSLYR